jgi:hypothetical protein
MLNESWYIFDMTNEHVDPRFLYWLSTRGIVAKVNGTGKRGLIANTKTALPDEIVINEEREWALLSEERKAILEPIVVTPENEPIPLCRLDEHDATVGKPERVIRNPLNENYGRPSEESLVDYFRETLPTIIELITRIETVDEQAGSNLLAGIGEAKHLLSHLFKTLKDLD